MPRKLWGELAKDATNGTQRQPQKMIPVAAKRVKLEEMQNSPLPSEKNITIKVRNPLVTQTIEVMKQTEMLQSLIDTYSQRSGTSNYLLNPCQMIPEIDFPSENAADFVSDDKFSKPIWFVPPLNTDFSRGVPTHYPQINVTVCRAAFRKAICGQLRVAGFTDTAESALVLFTDAVDEFMRSFMEQIRDVHANDPLREVRNEVEVRTLEKAYTALTNTSLTQVHNYYKHNLIARNRTEIAEFKGVLHEYAKLMKESQSMQKEEFQESDYLNILEMPQQHQQQQQANDQMASSGMSSTHTIANMGNVTNVASGSGGGNSATNMLNIFDGASTSHHHA